MLALPTASNHKNRYMFIPPHQPKITRISKATSLHTTYTINKQDPLTYTWIPSQLQYEDAKARITFIISMRSGVWLRINSISHSLH